MDNKKYTYNLNRIISFSLLWEVIFWVLFYITLASIESLSTKSNFIFKFPSAYYLLIILPVIIGLFIYNKLQHNRTINAKNARVAKSLVHPVSDIKSFIRFFFFRNAIVFLIIALSQPCYGTKKVAATTESLELVICLDISNSMNARDISKDISRLDISKRAIKQLINKLHGEKIGLCLFANDAFVQLPITRDYGAAKLFIDDIESSMITSQGTNIDVALRTSKDMFSKDKVTKGIILITDGENHEIDPTEILTEIKEEKIQLSVLGIGTTKGGLIPKNPDRPELGYKSNSLGRSVVTKLDEKFISSIASKGGGYANVSSSQFPDLSALLTQINQMKRTKIDTLEFDIQEERYTIPLFVSILFWLGFILWSNNYKALLKR